MKEFALKAVKSKTVKLALLQLIASIIVIAQTEFPEVGWVGVVKSVLDIYVRAITKEPLADK